MFSPRAAILLMPFIALAQAPETVKDLVERLTPEQKQQFHNASKSFNAEQYADALATLKQMLTDLKGDPIIAKFASEAAINTGDPAFAITTLRKVTEANPDDWQAAALLTRACAESGDSKCRDTGMAHMQDLHNRAVIPPNVQQYVLERIRSGQNTLVIRTSLAPSTLNTSLYKILYVHFSSGSALDLLRQIALELDLEPAHFRGDLVRQIADAIVRLNQSKKQHPILICDEAHLLPHPALEQLPLLLNFDMDSARYLTLLLVGQPLLRRTLSLQMHEALRQRVSTQYHLEGLTREELDAYLAQQLKAAGVSQQLFDDTARQGLYQATKGIPRKVNKLAMTALRLAAASKSQTVNEAILLDAAAEAML